MRLAEHVVEPAQKFECVEWGSHRVYSITEVRGFQELEYHSRLITSCFLERNEIRVTCSTQSNWNDSVNVHHYHRDTNTNLFKFYKNI